MTCSAYPLTEIDSISPSGETSKLLILTENPEPGCSKLTTSLVNASLKFQTLISNIHQ